MKKQKTNKSSKKINKIVIIAVCVAVCLYVFYAIYLLFRAPTDTFTVEQGTLYSEETVVGYVIRDEKVVQGKNYKNGMVQMVSEGERAAKKQPIFRYYSNNEKNLVEKIEELDVKIQKAMENETDMFSSDMKQLEKEIDQKVESLSTLNDLQKITEYKKEINNLVTKKAKIAGELSPSGSHIKKLVNQRSKYEKELNTGSEYVKAPISGIVSYRVDGLEDVLTPKNFDTLNKDVLENLDLKTGQITATSEEKGKIINNFNCYIAVIMNSDKAKQAEKGDKVSIRLSDKKEISATIEYINKKDENNIIIVLEIDNVEEELLNYRKISFDFIWWSDSGLKVPNRAIAEQNDKKYVVRTRAGYLDKLLVKVLRQNDKYSIVEPYDTEELKEMGYTVSQILDYKKITIYDEIILNPDLSKVE